ncbi:MAG: hypothetical protein WKF90_04650 [Pyrinomonadaceae bacterium]
MNDFSSTLVAHCGARKVTREELMDIFVPGVTRTHQPLSHYEIVEVLSEALSFRYLKVIRDEYAVSADGMKMFGVMDLNYEFSGCRFSIGLRNSNDKSMRLALTAGYRVFVCDNMAFSGDFTPMFHKHTRNLELKDSISIAVDRIHRGFEPLKAQVEAMHEQGLTDEEVKLIIYRAFLDKQIRGVPRHLLPQVHDLYFTPQHESFLPRNLWSLSNAFTSVFKKLTPVKQFEVTAKLGAYLSVVQKEFKFKRELNLDLSSVGNIRSDGQMPEGSAFRQDESEENIFQENFDEDDVAEDPYEEFDEYSDSEADDEIIEEYEKRLVA